jgi:hypothetical protein
MKVKYFETKHGDSHFLEKLQVKPEKIQKVKMSSCIAS